MESILLLINQEAASEQLRNCLSSSFRVLAQDAPDYLGASLVIVDESLDEEQGYLVRTIQKTGGRAPVPVLLVRAQLGPGPHRPGAELITPDDLLLAPFRNDEVIFRVRNLLFRGELQEKLKISSSDIHKLNEYIEHLTNQHDESPDAVDHLLYGSEELIRLATEMAGIAIWVYDFEKGRMSRTANHGGLYGMDWQDVWVADTFLDATCSEDRERVHKLIEDSLEPGGPDHYSFDFRVVWPDGSLHWLWASGFIAKRDASGRGLLIRGVLVDIGKRKEAELQSERLTRLYAGLSQCNQAIVRCKNEAELFPLICEYAVTYAGFKMAWIGLHDEDSKRIKPVAAFGKDTAYLDGIVISSAQEHPAGAGPVGVSARTGKPVWCLDIQNDPAMAFWRERARTYGWVSAVSLPLFCNGAVVGVFAVYTDELGAFREIERNLLVEMASDISFSLEIYRNTAEKLRSEQHIQYLAHYDSLTNLPNRVLLLDRFKHALNHAKRSNESFAVLFIDLDNFKTINDSLGHRIGDVLLVEISKRLKDETRSEDTTVRLGGDEFLMILPATDANGAAFVAEKLLERISRPAHIEEHELAVTASIGISIFPVDGLDVETLWKNADVAMYQAKKYGRCGYSFFTQDMQKASERFLLLGNALRSALPRRQFVLHYQPIVSIKDGCIIGAEALLRWEHPEFGMVSPLEFISIAEASGLIIPIGAWVLRTAASKAKEWSTKGFMPMTMAVNLSAVQFRKANLPDTILGLLSEVAVAPECMELELTEASAMAHPQQGIDMVNKLYERGIRLCIDDFGTGYSSLSYLKDFKVHKLKIDQSFVRNIPENSENQAIVNAIIGMAQSLGMKTLAEGVETAEQLAFLKASGCDEAQGYLFGAPMPADEFEKNYRRGAGG